MEVEGIVQDSIPLINEHPFRNAAYRRWLIGSAISLLGDQFYLVALPWLVLEKFGSATTLGALMMAGAIPRAALLLIGGVVTDRMSARRIIIMTSVIRAICVTITGILIEYGDLGILAIYTLVIAFGIADAFAMPAQSAFLPSILKREQLVAGSGLSQGVARFTTILGPISAGLLIAKFGVAPAFYIDAVSFLFVIGAMLVLSDPPRVPSRANAMKAVREGFAYVMRDTALKAMVLLAMMVNLCVTGPLSVGIADIAKTHLGSSSSYGILVSAAAAGGLAGAMLTSMWQVKRRGMLILAANFILGVCLVGIAPVFTNIYALSALLALIGGAAACINTHIGAWVMQRIDVSMRGRVSSVLILISLGAAPISMGLAGFAVARNTPAMFLVAGTALLCVTVIAAKGPSIKEIA